MSSRRRRCVRRAEWSGAAAAVARYVRAHAAPVPVPARAQTVAMLRDRGFKSVGTALRPGSSRALGANFGLLQPQLAIWVGNEAHGLSEAAISCCDETLYVPMAGMVESLNVAACAAVVVAEACRSAAPDACTQG